MTPEEKKTWAEDLLRCKCQNLGRMPTKKDFDNGFRYGYFFALVRYVLSNHKPTVFNSKTVGFLAFGHKMKPTKTGVELVAETSKTQSGENLTFWNIYRTMIKESLMSYRTISTAIFAVEL